jgi:hypothetical protein
MFDNIEKTIFDQQFLNVIVAGKNVPYIKAHIDISATSKIRAAFSLLIHKPEHYRLLPRYMGSFCKWRYMRIAYHD